MFTRIKQIKHQLSQTGLILSERGEVNISGILMMGIGMVFLAVGFIMFPIATTATDTLLAWAATVNVTITDASFTGFTSVVGITPLLILLGYISAAVITGFLGFKIQKTGGAGKATPGSLMMLGLSVVFIAIGLIIMPVALEGIATVLHGGGTGLNAAYVGLEPILLMTPLLILISFITSAVITGFFGIKNLASGSGN